MKVPLEVRLAAWRSRESAPAPRAPTEGPAPRAPAEGPAPAAAKPVAPKSRAGAPVPRAPAEDPAPAPAREPATSAAAEPLRRSKRGAPAPLKPQPYVEVPRLKDVWPSTPALAAAATNPSVDELSVDATAGLGPVGDAALTAAAVLPHRPTTSTKAEPSIDELVAHATAGNAGDAALTAAAPSPHRSTTTPDAALQEAFERSVADAVAGPAGAAWAAHFKVLHAIQLAVFPEGSPADYRVEGELQECLMAAFPELKDDASVLAMLAKAVPPRPSPKALKALIAAYPALAAAVAQLPQPPPPSPPPFALPPRSDRPRDWGLETPSRDATGPRRGGLNYAAIDVEATKRRTAAAARGKQQRQPGLVTDDRGEIVVIDTRDAGSSEDDPALDSGDDGTDDDYVETETARRKKEAYAMRFDPTLQTEEEADREDEEDFEATADMTDDEEGSRRKGRKNKVDKGKRKAVDSDSSKGPSKASATETAPEEESGGGHTHGPIPKDCKERVRAARENYDNALTEIATAYNRPLRTIKEVAGEVTRMPRKKIPWNIFQQWYSREGPKKKPAKSKSAYFGDPSSL